MTEDDAAPPTPITAAPGAGAQPAPPPTQLGERPGRLRSVDPDRYPDWEAIYLDNVERLYRIIYSRVGNRPDAEDLTAEVFRTALGPLRTSASIGEVRAYLLATARTVLAAHWKRRFQLEITRIDVERDIALLDEPPAESDAPQRVNRILAALPENYSRILELRFIQSCSLREAARTMNVSLSNAKVLQHRALRRAAQLSEELV